MHLVFFLQAEDGIRDYKVTGVQTCALPISLPSGRLGLAAAHVICAALIVMAAWAGALYSVLARDPASQNVTQAALGATWLAGALANWISLVLVVWTGMLIAFYDLAGKYLVALGLLTLGLIRFFHALVPGPQIP